MLAATALERMNAASSPGCRAQFELIAAVHHNAGKSRAAGSLTIYDLHSEDGSSLTCKAAKKNQRKPLNVSVRSMTIYTTYESMHQIKRFIAALQMFTGSLVALSLRPRERAPGHSFTTSAAQPPISSCDPIKRSSALVRPFVISGVR